MTTTLDDEVALLGITLHGLAEVLRISTSPALAEAYAAYEVARTYREHLPIATNTVASMLALTQAKREILLSYRLALVAPEPPVDLPEPEPASPEAAQRVESAGS